MNDRVWTSSKVPARTPGSTGARRSQVSASCRGNTAPRYHPIRCPHGRPAPFAGGSTRVGEARHHRTYCAGAGPHYLIGRYYDPATGQFLSVDPLVEQTAHGYEYTGDNPVNAIDPLGMITCGGWLSWVPGCGTATAIQHALSGVARAAWPNHFGSFLEGVDFSMEAIGAAGLGSLVFTASVAGEVPSFGLSTVGVLSSFGIFAGAGALAYVAYRSFSDAYAGAAVTRRSLSGPSSNIQKLSLLGARPC